MTVVKIGEFDVDLDKALPLRIRDWRALEKLGVTPDALEHASVGLLADLVHYVLHKADARITPDMVDELEPDDPRVLAVAEALRSASRTGARAQDPTSGPSTP